MQSLKISMTSCVFAILFYSCDLNETPISYLDSTNPKKSKLLQKSYSPDNRCFFTIIESGKDSLHDYTQLLLNFNYTGSGVYCVDGINKNISAHWKDDSTIVVETFKKYNPTSQKSSQVQSFRDIVKNRIPRKII